MSGKPFRQLLVVGAAVLAVTISLFTVFVSFSRAQAPCNPDAYTGQLGQTVPPGPAGLDINHDGKIDVVDFTLCWQIWDDYRKSHNIPYGTPAGSVGQFPSPTTVPNRPSLEAATDLRVRGGPDARCPQIGTISPGATYTVEAKNADSSWLQITYNGNSGWVSRDYVRISDPSLMFVVPSVKIGSCSGRPSLPPPPEGWGWINKARYEELISAYLEKEHEWDKALSFQSWVQDIGVDQARGMLIERGLQALGKEVASSVGVIVDAALLFGFGSRADTKHNLELYRSQRTQLEGYWNNPDYRNGDWVLVPWDVAEIPLISFPRFWQFWSNWLP